MNLEPSSVAILGIMLGAAFLVGGCSSTADSSSPNGGDGTAQVAADASPQAASDGSSFDAGLQDEGVSRDSGTPAVDGSVGDGSSPGTSGGDAGVDPDLACYSLTALACTQCCDQRHPTGSPIFNTAFDDCFCAPPNGINGYCQTACAQTDCSSAADAAPATTGDPCDLCTQSYLVDGGACQVQISNACRPTADCMLYWNCIDQCP